MKTTSGMGLSILAGGLAFVGTANATDLIINGSFEAGEGVGWVGHFNTYNYSAAYYTGPAVPASESPGSLYSWQHSLVNGDWTQPCTQTVDLTSVVPPGEIDAGMGRFTFSSWLASYGQPGSNPEQPYLTVQFFDGASAQVGSTVVIDRVTSSFFTTFADGVTTFDSTTHLHSWAKYVRPGSIPPGARTATVGITHSPNAGFSPTPDTYVDLLKFDVTSSFEAVPPNVDSAVPGNGAANVRPDVVITVKLADGTTAVNTNSIQFKFDGATVTPTIQKAGATTTIQYDPPGLLASLSGHTYRLVFSDNHAPVITQTNDFSFTVTRYYNILLPAPIYLETFESTAEGALPAGWTGLSYSDVPDPTCDPQAAGAGGLQDLNSACYANWVVVDSTRFHSAMLTYNAHTPETDYQRVLSTNAANVVNGAIVENLAQGKIAFGDSGYRDGNSQVVYLFSRDFDLTGRNNVYLAFNSLWEQNQDSIGAVEYSVDEGVTWLPVVYMIDGPDILLDSGGNVDAVATFGTVRVGGFQGQATYVDPISSQTVGGYYGAFIGVASNRWSTLAPYISARVDDNPVESKRVEVFRLPAADNKPKVRLRFAHAGTDSWYFGIDNVGLYSITTVAPPLLSGPRSTTDYYGNTVVLTVAQQGIGPFTYQWRRDNATLVGQTNSSLAISNAQPANAGSYDVIVGYPGGSITSTQAVLTLLPSPAYVVGQWDFDTFDLSASCGRDLDYFNLDVQLNTSFSDTDAFGLPRIGGGDAAIVMGFPGQIGATMGGYKMFHDIPGNGGGTNVNKYTLIMDLYYPNGSQNLRRALLQTDPNNNADADFRVDESNRLGVDGVYQGTVPSNTWNRIALAVDLSGPGPNPLVAKFVNGVKVGQQTLAAGRDARWSLVTAPVNPWALLFAGLNTEVQPGYVSSIQLRNGRLSDAQVARLGGPSARKIPGCIRILRDGNNLVVNWSGGVVLQSATSITGPWSDVNGAVSPYSVPSPTGSRFYRPKP